MTTVVQPHAVTDVVADAINRLDDGAALPGDKMRADVFDAQCRQSWDGFERQRAAIERLAWLDAHIKVCDGCEYCEASEGEA